MKNILLFISLFCDLSVSAQQSDTVEHYLTLGGKPCEPANAFYYRLGVKSGEQWKVKQFYIASQTKQMEGYYSKYGKDTFEIRNGAFTYYHENGKVQKRERYINDLKEGVLKGYDSTGKLVDSGFFRKGVPYDQHYKWYSNGQVSFKGLYDADGKGVGEEWAYFEDGKISHHRKTKEGYITDSVWTYYHENGAISCLEYYSKDSMERMDCFEEDGQPANIKYCEHIILAVSKVDIPTHLQKNLEYPREAVNNNVEGTVYLGFFVDKDGSVKDVKIIGRKVGMGCDEEAIRVMRLLPKWTPGRDHNRLGKVYFTQAVTFRLE